MAAISYKASAPGNMILLGEYAVTRDYPALVAAIDKKINVSLKPHDHASIHISSILGEYTCGIDHIEIVAPFEYVLTAIKQFHFKQGFKLTIESEIESGIGLSSSAAVTVATLKVLQQFTQQIISDELLIKQGITVIQSVQGNGSGADVAASVSGGIILYKKGRVVTQFETNPPIFIVFSGLKNKTSDAIKQFNRQKISDSFFTSTTQLVMQAIDALNHENWQQLGLLLNQGQTLLQTLGVSTDLLDQLVSTCQQQSSVFGAKISGSGFGDCIIGLGLIAKSAILNVSSDARIINARILNKEALE